MASQKTAELPGRGVYVVQVMLDTPRNIAVGSLGCLAFSRGSYLYVGSAQGNLPARVARHARSDKALRWHIDYLTASGRVPLAWAWDKPAEYECLIAGCLGQRFPVVTGFGASDCACAGHLFRAAAGPALRWIIECLEPPCARVRILEP
ncbi:MAG: GIY-YIG nuclease family protein [Armatimonadetes bacterium]|nr:GIY-YIG nuclease family protein [Armatimonadota bacterium]